MEWPFKLATQQALEPLADRHQCIETPSIRVAEKIGERYERDVEIMVRPVGLCSITFSP
jgi:hypothetical protein